MNPIISINIITHNRWHYLQYTIKSIQDQNFKNWELIIVDDASSDNTKELIKNFLKDKRIKYFLVEKQKNIAAVRNIALSKSKGEYIAILDSDDLWIDKDKLNKQLDYLQNNKDVVLVGSGAVVIDQNGRELRRVLKPENDQEIRKDFLLKNPFYHSSVMYRKRQIVNCGGYSGDYKYCDDFDLWLRLKNLGSLYNSPEYMIKYREHVDNESVKNTRVAIKDVFKLMGKYRKEHKASRLIFLKKIWQKIKERFC